MATQIHGLNSIPCFYQYWCQLPPVTRVAVEAVNQHGDAVTFPGFSDVEAHATPTLLGSSPLIRSAAGDRPPPVTL